jgi:hypothetical protein
MKSKINEAAIWITVVLAGLLFTALMSLFVVACEPTKQYTDCFDCTLETTFEQFSPNPKTVTLTAEFEYCDQPDDFGATWSRQNTYSDTTNHMTQIATCKRRLKDEPK